MKKSDEKRNLTHGQIEFLIWLIVIIFISFFSVIVWHLNQNSYESHRLFSPDVDGLIVGSPVRLMGIHVGYVSKVKIIGDEVYLKFILTDKSIELPRGTIATIEFTGLAGSKSLELYLPEKKLNDPSVPIIVVEPPKRLHDSLSLLNVMYNKITSITYKISWFGKKIVNAENEIESQKNKYAQKEDLENFINYSDKWFESFKMKLKNLDLSSDIKKNKKGANNEYEKCNRNY